MKRYFFVYLILSAFLFSACRTGKTLTETKEENKMSASDTQLVAQVIKDMPDFAALTAKMKLTLTIDGKEISGSGTFKLQKNNVIQLSISALGLFEVLRIEFMPSEILVISRMDKKYARIPYADFEMFKEVGVNFYSLQALFLNQLFELNKSDSNALEKAFELTKIGEKMVLYPATYNQTSCSFYLDDNTRIEETILSYGTKFQLQWGYRNFASLEDISFPKEMQLSASGSEKSLHLSFEFNSLKLNNFSWSPTQVSSSYEEMDAKNIFSGLQNTL